MNQKEKKEIDVKKIVSIFAVAFVVCTLFAGGVVRIGGHAGYSSEQFSLNEQLFGGKIATTEKSRGFSFAVEGEFSFEEFSDICLKAEVGFQTMGKLLTSTTTNSGTEETVASEASPVNGNVFVGIQYNVAFNEDFEGFGVFGAGATFGKVGDRDFNVRIGIGIETGIRYVMNEDFAFDLGVRMSMFFMNTDKTVAQKIKEVRKLGGSSFQGDLKAFVGVVYTIDDGKDL